MTDILWCLFAAIGHAGFAAIFRHIGKLYHEPFLITCSWLLVALCCWWLLCTLVALRDYLALRAQLSERVSAMNQENKA